MNVNSLIKEISSILGSERKVLKMLNQSESHSISINNVGVEENRQGRVKCLLGNNVVIERHNVELEISKGSEVLFSIYDFGKLNTDDIEKWLRSIKNELKELLKS